MTAATNRDRYRRIVARVRNIPGIHGLREYSVALYSRAYDGASLGYGTRTDTAVSITEQGGYPPKVRWLNDEEIAVAGYGTATVEIGPITPQFSAGGTALATLTRENLAANTEPHLVLTGPEFPTGANFRIIGLETHRALRIMVRAQRVADSG